MMTVETRHELLTHVTCPEDAWAIGRQAYTVGWPTPEPAENFIFMIHLADAELALEDEQTALANYVFGYLEAAAEARN